MSLSQKLLGLQPQQFGIDPYYVPAPPTAPPPAEPLGGTLQPQVVTVGSLSHFTSPKSPTVKC